MAYKIKLPKEDMKKLWNAVKEIIREHHQLILNKSESLRDSQYIVRDYLFNEYLPKQKISLEMFNLFKDDPNAYTYFTQDVWTQLEREGYKRPNAKPIGIFYWKEYSYTVDKISAFMPQIRGYIYVEKDGIASKLKELSNYGWGIVAAQGQATRTIRDLIKRTGKPCLIIHDYDPDGDIISDSIEKGSKRTTHLDLINDQATNFLLNDDQVDFLKEKYQNLPIQSLPDKWIGKWKRDYRIELSAFIVIKDSENPILDFVKAEMKRQGIPISLKPVSKSYLFREAVKDEIIWQVESIIEDILKEYSVEGKSCKVRIGDIDIKNNEDIITAIKKSITGIEDTANWTSEEDMEEECLEDVPKEWIER